MWKSLLSAFIVVRDRINSLSLSYVFHTSFCALLIAQLFLTINFLRYGFDQYSISSKSRLVQRVEAIKNVLQPDEIRLLLRDPPSLPAYRTLVPALLPYPMPLNRPQGADFTEYRTCRRNFDNPNGAVLKACVGVLERSGRYSKDFIQTGKYVYVIVEFIDRSMMLHRIGSPSVTAGDHVRIVFQKDDQYDDVAIVEQIRPTFKGLRQVATPFLVSSKSVGGLPMSHSQCQLRLPSEQPGRRIYLCMLSHDALPIFNRFSKQWPPAALDRSKINVRVAVMKLDRKTGIAVTRASTFVSINDRIADLPGSAIISIDKIVMPHVDEGVEVCIRDGHKIIWRSAAGICQSKGISGKSAKPNIIGSCDLWCLISRGIFTQRNNLQLKGFVDGVGSPEVIARYNEQLAGEIWIRENAFRATYLILLMMATGLVYAIVFRKVLLPIQQLSDNVEAATVDLSKRVVISTSSPSDELGILTRSFNALLARVTDVVEAEVNNLKMIGHDVRSPLQSLLAMPQTADAYRQIKRIQNAIERFDASSGPREAFERADLVSTREDLASFLNTLVENATGYGTFDNLIYRGPVSGLWVNCELTALEDVISHILTNGSRYREAGSDIVLSLSSEGDKAVLDIDNHGPRIADGMLEAIFEYGVTTQGPETKSLGQGLYAAKSFVTTMGGTIEAMNLTDGVRFRIVLTRSIAEKD
ncbi:HAMP domain-containing sensor histidine kinase [Sphingomonas sp. Leaf37]|uniref:HAMP domain-containing sensor histidine kinase n=1 Tax=Sphingomonas sp. Leaf37 TaxID=2876552 RepID=UPI001E55D5D4|nr:HAMP domain-containing sensor histidine kinase [Sphingomonas sp. Leaf37]